MSLGAAAPIEVHGLQFEVAGFSEQGPRSENQDAFSTDAFESTGIVALADGMGGEKSGRVAADTALKALVTGGPIRSFDDARRAARNADAAVAGAAETNPEERSGMGCALALLALAPRSDGLIWIAGHVGDVRILSRTPDGTLRLETRDHTPAFARWEAGEVTLDEIADTAGANRLQRAVGRGAEADVTWIPARPGWSWLLVSDGIYKSMRLDELERALEASSATEACETIRRKVEERGPEDNFTAVLVRALPTSGATPITAPGVTRTMPNPVNDRSSRASRSGSSVVLMLLSVAALLLAGFALWRTMDSAANEAQHLEIERLRTEVDSLQAQVRRFAEPFGPTDPAALPAPQSTAPAGTTGITRP